MGVPPISNLLRQTIPHTEGRTVYKDTHTPHSSTTEITIVCDSIEEVKMTCHFFYIIGVFEVRIVGFIYYFE